MENKSVYEEVRFVALQKAIEFLGPDGGEGFTPEELIGWAKALEKYLKGEDNAN